ncbi:MAG: hypothetical protein QOE76_1909 [Frankiales bacterium]|nr:hypothetical protein [Frankiales bacterium]
MAELLAVLSSVMWGTADFLGGTFTRRLRPLSVVSVTMPAAVPVLLGVVLLTGDYRSPTGYLPWALASGPVGLLAVSSFYRALATGTMGVVAPVAATGVVVPLVVGLAQGATPSPVQLAGLFLATAATIGVSASGRVREERPARLPLVLAFVSGLGFGFVTVGIGEGSHSSVLMTLLVMRATSSTVLLLVWLALRERPALAKRDVGALWLVGLMDAGANAVYGSAVRLGVFAIIVVLGSLYPAATVLLARQVHKERLSRLQLVGVLALLVAVPMIAAG